MVSKFPRDFVLGTATASYQIEGAVRAGGRGVSIWDTFSHAPGKTHNGETGDIACDHYHRWREDIALLRQLNMDAYRFSIAWPRILPEGRGPVNQAGLDFYSRLVDGLLEAGITPFATLYHWDLPQALQDEADPGSAVGGWVRRSIVDDYVAYVDVVSRALGDRVKYWMTFNEPFIFTWLGYVYGSLAPGVNIFNPGFALSATHHCLLAHGAAAKVLRESVSGAQVGIVNYLQSVEAASDKPEDQSAMKRYDGYVNRWYLDPIFKGSYPEDIAAVYGQLGVMPHIEPGDMEQINVPLDFLGVNHYERAIVEHGSALPVLNVNLIKPSDSEYTAMNWEVYPPSIYHVLKRVAADYQPPAMYITENGAAFDDTISSDGQIHDSRRVAYLRDYFEQAAKAVAEGVPLKGYFVWSLMDNFEWAEGYSKRFGVVYVDYRTQRRTIKDSGRYLAQTAADKRR